MPILVTSGRGCTAAAAAATATATATAPKTAVHISFSFLTFLTNVSLFSLFLIAAVSAIQTPFPSGALGSVGGGQILDRAQPRSLFHCCGSLLALFTF